MRRINIIKLLFMIMILSSCQGQSKADKKAVSDNNNNKGSQINDDMLKEVLKSQLVDGKELGGDEYESHKYTEKDLEATAAIVQDELAKNGYKFPTQTGFNDKIKSIFNRIIDNTSAKNYLYVNFTTPCDREAVYSRVNVIANGVFVVKDRSFITDLYAIPELIDYQSKYPELNNVEDAKITKQNPDLGNQMQIPHWKEVKNLKEQRKKNIQTIVARNMYLFNDSKVHGLWLRQNDPVFATGLVKVFGYTKDYEMLKWVLQNTPLKQGDEDYFGKLLWTKHCDNRIAIHQQTLDVINSLDESERNKYLNYLKEYLDYFLDYDQHPENITTEQKSQIIAYIVNFGEKFRYENLGKPDKYKFMGRVYMRDFNDAYKKEFKKNKYYNLPHFQVNFEKAADYWEELVKENDGE